MEQACDCRNFVTYAVAAACKRTSDQCCEAAEFPVSCCFSRKRCRLGSDGDGDGDGEGVGVGVYAGSCLGLLGVLRVLGRACCVPCLSCRRTGTNGRGSRMGLGQLRSSYTAGSRPKGWRRGLAEDGTLASGSGSKSWACLASSKAAMNGGRRQTRSWQAARERRTGLEICRLEPDGNDKWGGPPANDSGSRLVCRLVGS